MVYGRSRAKGLTRFLFDQGYAVCMSNRTDPLAASNCVDTSVAFRCANDMPNGLLIQTKGGNRKETETLDLVQKKNVVLYITVTSRSEEIRKRVEPGAAPYKTRLELARYAISRGWGVIIGLNPLWRPWMSLEDLDQTVRDFAMIGACDFLVQPLHISSFLLENMPATCRDRLTAEELEGSSGAKKKDSPNIKFFRDAVKLLCNLEMELPIHWMPTFFRARESHMLDNACRILGKCFRSTQAFVDWAISSPNRFFSSEDFVSVLCNGGNEDLFQYGARNITGYLFCINRSGWKKSSSAKAAYTIADVYAEIFNNADFSPSPQNLGGRFVPVVDDNGRFIRDARGGKILCKTDYDWKAWENKTISLAFLKGKGVCIDELDRFEI